VAGVHATSALLNTPVLDSYAFDPAKSMIGCNQDKPERESVRCDQHVQVPHPAALALESSPKSPILTGCGGVPGQNRYTRQEEFDQTM